MNKIFLSMIALIAIQVHAAEKQKAPTALTPPRRPTSHTTSVQEMIETGPPQMRLHALAMLSQGKAKLNDSFLKTFAFCAKDKNVPVRSVAARILGSNWIKEGKEQNPEAIELLLTFASDESKDVRFSAVYYGLANIKNKSDKVIERLIAIAGTEGESLLQKKIQEGLKADKDKVIELLNARLNLSDENQAIRAFEIYEDLTGLKPEHSDRFLNMPSSRPVLFIFETNQTDYEQHKTALAEELKSLKIEQPDLFISGPSGQHLIMLKIYNTGERIRVEKWLKDHKNFSISQKLWLTPELEARMEAMRTTKQ